MSRLTSSSGASSLTAGSKHCASNPLEADEGPSPVAAVAADDDAVDSGTSVALYEPIAVDMEVELQRSGSPSNDSTTSSTMSHSRTSTTSSGWRRNNPYTLRRRSSNSDTAGSPVASLTPRSPRQRQERPVDGGTQLDVVRVALESSSGGSGSGNSLFGGLQTQQHAFLFDPTHAVEDERSSDGGIQRCRSSSWTSTSSTFDKASGNPLTDGEARTRNSAWSYEQHNTLVTTDAPFSAHTLANEGRRVAHQQQTGMTSAPTGSSAAPLPADYRQSLPHSSSVDGRMAMPSNVRTVPHALHTTNASNTSRSPSDGHSVSPPLMASPSQQSPTHASQLSAQQRPQPQPHKLFDAGGGHAQHADGSSTLGCDTLPPGVVFSIYPPNNAQAQPQQTPSEKILRTSGASNVYQVLLKAHQLREAKLQEALVATGKRPTSMPPVKQPHGLKPRHCAHFQFKRVCNLGSECNFIHSLVPYVQGGGNASGNGPGALVGVGVAPPQHHQHAAVASGPRPTAYTAIPPPPPPPPPASPGFLVHHATPPPMMAHTGGYFTGSPSASQPTHSFRFQQPQSAYTGHPPYAQSNGSSYPPIGGGGVDYCLPTTNPHDVGGARGFGLQPPPPPQRASPLAAPSGGVPSYPPYNVSQHNVGQGYNYHSTTGHHHHHQHHYYSTQ